MPNEFWELTPGELNIIIDVYTTKRQDEFKSNITVAYYNAYFQRAKHMPKLSKILEDIDRSTKKEMSDESMFKVVQKLHEMLGGR